MQRLKVAINILYIQRYLLEKYIMEQEYVIGVANRYALFLEECSHEEDPYNIIKNAEAEKAKKKTLKTVSGESKENKGKQNLKGKTTLPSARKVQGIKETQNVKENDAVTVNKPKPQGE